MGRPRTNPTVAPSAHRHPIPDTDRIAGTIKSLVVDRGFGFISGPGRQQFFFHVSGVEEIPFRNLEEGQAVTFVIVDHPKGPRAERVRVEGPQHP